MTDLEKIQHLEERLVVLESEKQAILKNLMSVQETCVLYQVELEVYKKALEISCEWNELNLCYLNVDECLQKARE